MSKHRQDAGALQQEERELTRRLLEKLKSSAVKSKPEDTRVAKSPFAKRDNTPGPKPSVPNRPITSENLLELIEETLKNAMQHKDGPIGPGLMLKQGVPGLKADKEKNFAGYPRDSEWTIVQIPDDQQTERGNLSGDERVAFYARAPGAKIEDLPITVGEVKKFRMEPPALSTSKDRKGA